MKTQVTRRIPMAAAVCLALAALALLFPASGTAAPPNPGHAWSEIENHGTSGDPVDTYWLGTTGSEALELKVNNERALRLEPQPWSPNVIVGYSGNSVTPGVEGATISGGGASFCPPPSHPIPNRVTDSGGTIGGGNNNQAGDDAGTTDDATGGTVGGGGNNTASGEVATVGGGAGNTASGDHTTVAGGDMNTASGQQATVGGGYDNDASGEWATVAGGGNNTASGEVATVGGGAGNTASGQRATVGGGLMNTASGQLATVGGGAGNTASGTRATVAGGANNTASGLYATVPGGDQNTAQGQYSFAAGLRAKIDAAHDGTFLLADNNDFDFNSAAANEFAVRATGGARFVLDIDESGNPTWTCSVSDGGTWSCSSARALKENLVAADGRDILERLSDVPVFTWNAKDQDSPIRHIGPMADDFYAAFGVGEDDGRLATIDLDGVALAAIQGLYELSQEQAARIDALEDENVTLQQRLDDLESRVSALEEGNGGSALVSQASSSSGLPITWVALGGGLTLAMAGLAIVQRRFAGGRR